MSLTSFVSSTTGSSMPLMSGNSPVKKTGLANSSPVLPHVPRERLLARMASEPEMDIKSTLKANLARLKQARDTEIEKETRACRENIEQCDADIEKTQARIDELELKKQSIEAKIVSIEDPIPDSLTTIREEIKSEIQQLIDCWREKKPCQANIKAATLVISEKYKPDIDEINKQLALFDNETS